MCYLNWDLVAFDLLLFITDIRYTTVMAHLKSHRHVCNTFIGSNYLISVKLSMCGAPLDDNPSYTFKLYRHRASST